MKPQTVFSSLRRTGGFTLVELLIVVAIIAILASIAVANFLEAQIRSKVTRAHADLRTIALALEAYRTDNVSYPPTPMDALSDRNLRLVRLTTPVAYLSTAPQEVFSEGRTGPATYPYWSAALTDAMKYSPIFFHIPDEGKRRGRWALFSRGPDRDYEMAVEEGGGGLLIYYDPSNGSASNGDLMRFGP